MKLPFNLDNIRLRNKMMIIYVLCVLLPIVLTNVVFYRATTEKVKNQRMQDIERALEQVKNEFRSEIEDAVSVSSVFFTDYNLNQILEEEYQNPADYVSAYDSYFRRILNSYTPVYTSMQNIKIYLDNPTMLHSGGIGFLSEQAKESVWYRALRDAKNANPVLVRTAREDTFVPGLGSPYRDTFSIVRRMNYFDGNKWEKILKIELRTSAVEQVFGNLNLNGYVYLLNEKGSIEYTTDPNVNWPVDTVFYNELQKPKDAIEFETTYAGISYMKGWKIVGTISEEEVFRVVRKSREFIIWLAAANLFISTLIITWISRSMNVRLVNILRHMKKVKNQQFVTIEDGASRDEIGQLQVEFNRMSLQIKRLINDVYIADIERKSLEIEHRKAQLNALQSQINPHFLFNSLETIRMRSLIKNETETAKIIHNMAKLLRSSLAWSKDRVTVEEELEFILCFLEIQQYRFGDRLVYRLDVDPNAKKAVIPKMVFLPFVENASIHGIEPLKHGGEIDIRIELGTDCLEFSIRDNGVGMKKEQVERLYSFLDNVEELGERIGVQNVIYRLKMLYGDRIRLFIDSAPGEGTHIQISLPVQADPDPQT